MKNGRRWIIIGMVLFVVLSYMMTYTVKFTEKAIKTTFGKAADAPITKPGLGFIIPYVQKVTKYDSRVRYLESKPETQQTKDQRQIVITSYVAWRVSDPNIFYQKFSGKGDKAINHYKGAEALLGDKMRHAMGEISKFKFDELLSASGSSKLEICEKNILQQLNDQGADDTGSQKDMTREYGIEPVVVGIIGIELPEDTTVTVFERMQQERTTIAAKATNEGKSIGETIRQNANSAAQKIMAFADKRAAAIRAEGEIEAQQFLAELSKEPDLAIFLRNMELMRDAFGTNKATLVIPAGPIGGWAGMDLFRPDAGKDLRSGWLPNWQFNQFQNDGTETTESEGGERKLSKEESTRKAKLQAGPDDLNKKLGDEVNP
ncbi:MAG: hypothetical protein H7210_12985 [Pyrinomonadaceae bacterium]|nr:hypothetical protein [Phycisphaerales bacterium]